MKKGYLLILAISATLVLAGDTPPEAAKPKGEKAQVVLLPLPNGKVMILEVRSIIDAEDVPDELARLYPGAIQKYVPISPPGSQNPST